MRSSSTTPALALLLAAAALLAAVWLWPGQGGAPLPTRWRGAAAQQGGISGAAAPLDGAQLDLQVEPGLYAGQEGRLRAEVADALAYVAARFGSPPSARLTASLHADPGCGLRGITYTDIRDAQVFTCDSIPRDRAVAIMAHELTHQLAQDRYGPPHLRADLILSEGVATWAAGRYWLGGRPDFRTYVRDQRRAGRLYPLATSYAGLGAEGMNTLYYEWASFCEYLIGAYGRPAFDRAYVSGAGVPGSAGYEAAFGKPLPALEQEWLAWLDSAP